MASPFKHISQLQSLADFTKLTKQVIGKLTEEPVYPIIHVEGKDVDEKSR